MLNALKRLIRLLHTPGPSPPTRRPVIPANLPCPYCGAVQYPTPRRPAPCPDCGRTIRPWIDPRDRTLHLLTNSQHRHRRREIRAMIDDLAEHDETQR